MFLLLRNGQPISNCYFRLWESVLLSHALWKMSLSSNSVYSSVLLYNPYVLTRPYQHLTFVALISLHQIICISHYISISIVGFGDSAWASRMDTLLSHQKRTCHSTTKVFWLFDELSVVFKPFNIMPLSNIMWYSTEIEHSITRTFINRL